MTPNRTSRTVGRLELSYTTSLRTSPGSGTTTGVVEKVAVPAKVAFLMMNAPTPLNIGGVKVADPAHVARGVFGAPVAE